MFLPPLLTAFVNRAGRFGLGIPVDHHLVFHWWAGRFVDVDMNVRVVSHVASPVSADMARDSQGLRLGANRRWLPVVVVVSHRSPSLKAVPMKSSTPWTGHGVALSKLTSAASGSAIHRPNGGGYERCSNFSPPGTITRQDS
jgi:hypothetical protein